MRLRRRLTAPFRAASLPVLAGNGKGLRVKADRAILRVLPHGEQAVEDAFCERARGGVVYDVGANIGWYSLLAAKRGARVFAFEPDTRNAGVLATNAQTNGFAERLDAVPAAASDRDGWCSFEDRGSLQSRVADNGSANSGHQVPCVQLDTWASLTGSAPTLVKIDVEGHEVSVLRGMRRILADAQPALIIETHRTKDAVTAELASLGYQTRPLTARHLLATPDGGQPAVS